jgi:hypothetical protein
MLTAHLCKRAPRLSAAEVEEAYGRVVGALLEQDPRGRPAEERWQLAF